MVIELPRAIEERLDKIASKTGIQKESHIIEAIVRYIEDLEDALEAETAYEEFLSSGEQSIPIEEIEKKIDMED